MSLRDLYGLLNAQVEAGDWWPADSDFEIIVGAILTQNTNWRNVEMSLGRLKEAGALTPQALVEMEEEGLQDLIRSSGFYRAKTTYLKAMSRWVLDQGDQAPAMSTEALRSSLLAVPGIGGETADDLLLYVYQRPVFIYDLYARRLLKAAGFGTFKTYDKAKKAIDPLVEKEGFTIMELADFHGLIVEAGKKARAYGGWDRAFEALLAGRF